MHIPTYAGRLRVRVSLTLYTDIRFLGLFRDPDRVCNKCSTAHENFSGRYKELLDINMVMSIDEYESIMMGG